jgi:hypothetical protein
MALTSNLLHQSLITAHVLQGSFRLRVSTDQIVLGAKGGKEGRKRVGERRAGMKQCCANQLLLMAKDGGSHETASRKMTESLSILSVACSTAENLRSLAGSEAASSCPRVRNVLIVVFRVG